MKSHEVLRRYKKDMLQGEDYADKELEENIINYAKDKCISILMLDGREHCDAGYLVKQYKRIFK